MSAALRNAWTTIVKTKRAYLDPHEDFGRANIFRAAISTYIGAYLLFKWNSNRKARALKDAQRAAAAPATPVVAAAGAKH